MALVNTAYLQSAIDALKQEIAKLPQDNFTLQALQFLEQGFQLLEKRMDAGF